MNLTNASLAVLPVQTPAYDRKGVTTGIVHLGLGAFHRAHQAVYVDDVLTQDQSWGIVGASLRSDDAARALNPQNGLYSVVTKSASGSQCRVIGSLNHVLCAADDPDALISQMADPQVRIVSLTITEKGYCRNASGDGLDPDHPDIQYDLQNPNRPRSALGYITAALSKRKLSGAGPFTVLSCDNLPDNGATTQRVVLQLARLIDSGLADWIRDHVTFPGTMVDRIVPATTDADREDTKTLLGVADAWPIVTEPFGQWVIEDHFCAGRPQFDHPDIILTQDVRPFETMKLRLLNGSHSALAYLGLLAGHKTVAQAMEDPAIADFVAALMRDEIAPTLNVPANIRLKDYRAALVARFKNPALQHALIQIAMDGSQKIPQRILSPIRDRISKGHTFDRLAHVIAGWLRFVAAKEAGEYCFPLQDPMADTLRAQPVETLIKTEKIFGELASSPTFTRTIMQVYQNQEPLSQR